MSNKRLLFNMGAGDAKKESSSGPPSSNFMHCEVCDKWFHVNDKETHFNGNKHNFRVRKLNAAKHREKENQNPPKFKCDICRTNFTDEGFYEVHKGSKTHKRNLRRLQRKLEAEANSSTESSVLKPMVSSNFTKPVGRRMVPRERSIQSVSSIDEIPKISEYVYHREKYRPRNMKTDENHYKAYIHSVTAYWALNLAVDSNIQDYKISVNDKAWKSFGDVVIELLFITGEHTSYVIQFKQISNNNKNIESLTEGKFNFEKFVVQLPDLGTVENLKSVKFVIFTTATPTVNFEKSVKVKASTFKQNGFKVPDKDMDISIRALSAKKKDPVNTLEDNENIYFFTADKEWGLPRIYLYSQQKRIKHFGTAIDNVILEKFDKSKQIHRDFIKYIANWSEGFLGGTYKLQKEDIALKLGDLLLHDYRKRPETFITPKSEQFALWNTAAKVCQPLNACIEKNFGVKIDTLTNSVNITQKVLENIKNPILKMFLFEEICLNQLDDDVPLGIVYLVFWKSGLIPMLLTTEDSIAQDFVLCVIEFVKSLNAQRTYLLRPFKDKTLAVKTFMKSYKSLSFFITVDNLTNVLPLYVLDFTKITVSDTLSVSLNDIKTNDTFFLKKLTTNEFFDICQGSCSFKPISDILKTRIIEETNLSLEDDLMVQLKNEIYPKKEISSSQENVSNIGLRGIDPRFLSV